jgi:hypothetical protein
MKIKAILSVFVISAAVIAATLLAGCVGTKITYSPREHMVSVERHNNILEIGPCGMPWNYDELFVILLKEGSDRCAASQLEVYQHGRLQVQSGYVALNRTNKTVTIDLTLLALEGVREVWRPFEYNGTHKYVESDPAQGMLTRKFLQDFERTNKPSFYFHR